MIVLAISSITNIIEGSERANMFYLQKTKLHIKNAFWSLKSHGNILSFKDIGLNGYHIIINEIWNIFISWDLTCVLEKITCLFLRFVLHKVQWKSIML